MPTFVYLMENKHPLNKEIVDRHIEHLRALDDAKQLVLCGPFTDYQGGMVVLNCDTYEEADAIAKRDPFISEGYKYYELRTLEVANRSNDYLSD